MFKVNIISRVLTLVVLSYAFSSCVLAQDEIYDNHVFEPSIHTIILKKDISIYDPLPVIALNSSEKLVLMFDQLSPNNEFYNYSFKHCTSDWTASDLQPMEYVRGNPMGEITEYTFSSNTYKKYTHYSLTFPQTDMQIKKSGNYILKVFRNFNDEDVVLTRRFMVLDNQTTISTDISSATNAEFRFSHQEIDFTVGYKEFNIPNPFTDINVTILQNNSWSNSIFGLKPLFVNNSQLSFNYEDKNLFPATNEFRFFDMRSLRFFSNRVVKKYVDTIQNLVLAPDELRSHLSYLRTIDYNGKRVISNSDGVDIVEDGDYALVHFYLKSKDKSHLGELYVYGELSDWQCQDKFKMKYWPDFEMYSCSVLLKQSYYNYHYVVKDKTGNIEYSFTEGNHQETENDYTILVYHKNVFYGYDELIGIRTQNSNTLK